MVQFDEIRIMQILYRPFDKTFVTIHLYVELGVHGGGLDVLRRAARVVARPPAAPRQHRPPRLLAVQRGLAHPVVRPDVDQVQVRELGWEGMAVGQLVQWARICP